MSNTKTLNDLIEDISSALQEAYQLGRKEALDDLVSTLQQKQQPHPQPKPKTTQALKRARYRHKYGYLQRIILMEIGTKGIEINSLRHRIISEGGKLWSYRKSLEKLEKQGLVLRLNGGFTLTEHGEKMATQLGLFKDTAAATA